MACDLVRPRCDIQAVDENNVSAVSGGSSDDVAFEDQVQRFMTLNTALRNVASKANGLILAIKAQGEVGVVHASRPEPCAHVCTPCSYDCVKV